MARIVDLQSHAAQLVDALEIYQERWQRVRAEWDDSRADHVERKYLEPLVPRIRSTLDAIGRLDHFLTGLQQEFEDRGDTA